MSEFTTPSSSAAAFNHSAAVAAAAGESSTPPQSSDGAGGTSEDVLRKQLRAALQRMARREPLEPSYKKMLLQRSNALTRQPATIPKHKFYKAIGSRLRERVEVYSREIQGKDPFDRIMQRKPLQEQEMRTAFTLREAKDYEQKPLLEATLIATAMHPERKRSLDGMALFLQARKQDKMAKFGGGAGSITAGSNAASSINRTEAAHQQALLESQHKAARQWEEARMQRERDERRQREDDLAHDSGSSNRRRENTNNSGPRAALHKIIEPVFKKLWEMEFPSVGGSNPFRIVIDRQTAQQIAPDYFSIITTPMNLTYIQDKVRTMQYSTLPEFFGDVDLMISNALKYNAGDDNPYRIAALELKAVHDKIVKKVWKSIQEKQQSRNK